MGDATRPARTHCKHGHELSGWNAMVHPGRPVACRTCQYERNNAYKARKKALRPPPPTMADRFWAKVDAEGDCWEWTGAKAGGGYGAFFTTSGKVQAHRWSYEHLVGPIPEGLQIDHLCKNRACVNPDHLEPVTRLENVWRGAGGAWNRSKMHCPQGHPYEGDNVKLARRSNRRSVGRECRTCLREQAHRYNRQRRGEPQGPKTHCPQGHPYSGENLRVYNGRRHCRTCTRESGRRSKAKKRQATGA